MGIALNFYMTKTDDNKLYGKTGFQTQSAKTDKVVLANMNQIEDYLQRGLLKDLDGNVATTGAVIMMYARVDVIKDKDDIDPVPGFVDATGEFQECEPAVVEAESTDDIPF